MKAYILFWQTFPAAGMLPGFMKEEIPGCSRKPTPGGQEIIAAWAFLTGLPLLLPSCPLKVTADGYWMEASGDRQPKE